MHAPEREQGHGRAAGHYGDGAGGQNCATGFLVNNLAFTDIEIISNTLNSSHTRHCSPVFPLRYSHSGDGSNLAELLLRHVVLRSNPSDVLGYAHVPSSRCTVKIFLQNMTNLLYSHYMFGYSLRHTKRGGDSMELVDARKKARYSQEAVAGLLGISRPTYARMESNPDSVTIEDAKRLAKLFGVRVADIFFGSNDS
jgi:putative transcriptional regulator